jgi:hypothetical protein
MTIIAQQNGGVPRHSIEHIKRASDSEMQRRFFRASMSATALQQRCSAERTSRAHRNKNYTVDAGELCRRSHQAQHDMTPTARNLKSPSLD